MHPLAASSSSFYPPTSSHTPLDIARQSPRFRTGVLAALLASLESGTCAPSGALERAAEVFRRAALVSTDADARALALQGLALTRGAAHPAVPAQQPNAGLARVRHEARGGWVGDEAQWEQSAREFRIRVEERGEEAESDEEEGEDGRPDGKGAEARRRKTPPAAAAAPVVLAPAPAQTAFPATTAFAAPSAPVGAAPATTNGFAAFAPPTFGAAAPKPRAQDKPAPAEEVIATTTLSEFAPSTGVKVATLDVETVPSTKGKAARAPAAAATEGKADSDNEDEDEGMPMIDVGSDDE